MVAREDTGCCGRGMNVCQCFGETPAKPERSFVCRRRFDESVQKLVQEERFDRAVAFEDGKRLERDLVAASDGDQIAGASSELAEEFRSWGENDGGFGRFACRR